MRELKQRQTDMNIDVLDTEALREKVQTGTGYICAVKEVLPLYQGLQYLKKILSIDLAW